MKLLLNYLLTCLLFILLGCSVDPAYEAEKAYWEVQRLAISLSESNPEGLEKKHYKQVIDALDQASQIDPLGALSAKMQFQIAQIYLSLGEREQAHEVLEAVYLRFSESENQDEPSIRNVAAQAAFMSANLYKLKGEIEEANKRYDMILETYPLTQVGLKLPVDMVKYYKKQGNASEIKDTFSRARAHYENLLKIYVGTPTGENIKFYSLQIYEEEEAWQDILDFWNSEIQTRKGLANVIAARVAKANLLATKMNNASEAESIYKDIIENFPNSPSVPILRVRLGYLQSANSELEEARRTFNEVLADFPENENLIIQSKLGLVAIDRTEGKHEEVIVEYENIFKTYPNHPSTIQIPFNKYFYLRNLAKDKSELDEAFEEAFSEYSSRWENGGSGQPDLVVGRMLFVLLVQQGDWEKALEHLRSMINRFPDNATLVNMMKSIYEKNEQDPVKALQSFFPTQSDGAPVQNIEETLDNLPELP